MDGPFGRIAPRRRQARGYFTADLAMAVAGAVLLAAVAVTVTLGAIDRSNPQRSAVFVGQQMEAFTSDAQRFGRAGAIGTALRSAAIPGGGTATLGPACAMDAGDTGFAGTLSTAANVITCTFCSTDALAPAGVNLATCQTPTPTLPLRCNTRANQRASLASAPETPRIAPTSTEALMGIWIPAADRAEAIELEHHLGSLLTQSGLPGFADSLSRLGSSTYRVDTQRPRVLFSRTANGVLVCF